MKHTTTLLLAIVLSCTSVMAETLAERLEQPLVVVLADEWDHPINKEITHAISNYWNLNEVHYITESDYQEIPLSDNSCFLIYQKHQSVEDEGTTVYSEVIRVVGFSASGKRVRNFAGAPLLWEEGEDHQLAMVIAVRMLQDKLQFALFSEHGEAGFAYQTERIQQKNAVVKLKKLYIAAQDLEDELDFASIRALYDGEVKIVDRSYIDKLISEAPEDALYVVVNNRQTSGFTYVNTKMVIDAVDGALVYKDENMNFEPKGFDKRDFKKLAD